MDISYECCIGSSKKFEIFYIYSMNFPNILSHSVLLYLPGDLHFIHSPANNDFCSLLLICSQASNICPHDCPWAVFGMEGQQPKY